ncbi:UNVERIFIED_CONTAM: hypothetical protein FKN15_050574 [Acipenser sinensis]
MRLQTQQVSCYCETACVKAVTDPAWKASDADKSRSGPGSTVQCSRRSGTTETEESPPIRGSACCTSVPSLNTVGRIKGRDVAASGEREREAVSGASGACPGHRNKWWTAAAELWRSVRKEQKKPRGRAKEKRH